MSTVDMTLPITRDDLGYVRPEWFGPCTPDANTDRPGTDCAPAIQAAIDTGLPVRLRPGRYGIGSTLRMNPAVGLDLGGTFGGCLGPDSPAAGSWLLWQGAAGGKSLSLGGIKCRIRNLGFGCVETTSLDRCLDIETPTAYPNVSSQHFIENVVFDGRFGPVRCGVVAGEDGTANGEFMWFRSCLTRYCSYAGVSIPNGTKQAKDWVFEDCTFGGSGQYADYGVCFNGGSAKFWRCNFDALGCAAAWFGGSNEAITFLDCTGETNRRFLQLSGVLNLNLIGCRINLINALNPQPAGSEFIGGGNNWVILGCVFEEADNLVGFLRPADGGTAVVGGCQFHSAIPFPADDLTRFNLFPMCVRVDQGNNLLPQGGAYYQRNVPGVTHAGNRLVFTSGHWPLAGTYSGGTYNPGPGEGAVFLDSGKLWLQLPGASPVALSPVAPSPA